MMRVPIVGFPDYAVDSNGDVWRVVATTTGRRWKNRAVPYKLTPVVASGTGYLRVILCKDGKRYMMGIHRIVCEAFHGPSQGRFACHENGARIDNRPENLRWDTQAGNMSDTAKHGTRACGCKLPQARLTSADVEWIRAYPKKRGMFSEMGRRLNLRRGIIREAYLGITWAHLNKENVSSPAQFV